MKHKRAIFLSVCLVLTLILSVFLVLRIRYSTGSELSQPEIVVRATSIANEEFQAVVSTINAERLTFGQNGALGCSWRQRLMQTFDSLPWKSCDPNETFWRVRMKGIFRWVDNSVTPDLNIDFYSNGTVMAKWSGPY